jgi:hypothetical protein
MKINAKSLIVFAALAAICQPAVSDAASPEASNLRALEDTNEMGKSVVLITTASGSGTGFACEFRNQQYIATNLHVIEGADVITVKPLSGDPVQLSGKLIVAEDADVCLLGIKGSLSDLGITPLTFMENVVAQSKVADEVVCLGNSLGNGVITTTKGAIKAYGQPRIEIDCPVVPGNSGGPIIHTDSGKVIGLVTEAIINKLSFGELGKAASKSKQSQVRDISYFGHRVDTIKKWTGSTVAEYSKSSLAIGKASNGLMSAAYFIADKSGWESDSRLSEALSDFEKFLDQAAAKTHKTVEITDYVNEYGVVVRSDVRERSKSVSQADYEAARNRFKRAVEWKIQSDQKTLDTVKPIGYRQNEARKLAVDFGGEVLNLSKKL